MAEIPFTRPESPQGTVARYEQQNPQAAAQGWDRVAGASDQFANRLLRMQQANQQTQGELILSSSLNSAKQKVMQSTDYTGGGATFAQHVSDLNDSIDAMNVDDPVKQKLRSSLAAMNIGASHEIDQWSYDGQKKDSLDNLMAANHNVSQQYITATDPKQRAQLAQQMQTQIQRYHGTLLSDADANLMTQQQLEKTENGAASADVDRDPQTALTNLQAKDKNGNYTYLPNMDADARQQLTLEAQRRIKQSEAFDEDSQRQNIQDQVASEYTYGKHDPTKDTAIRLALSKDPQALAAYNQQMGIAHSENITISNLPYVDPNKMQGYVDSLKPAVGADNFELRQKIYTYAEGKMTQVLTARQNDPASLYTPDLTRYMQQHPDQNTPTGTIEANYSFERAHGILPQNQKPYSIDQAKSLVQNFNQLDPAHQEAFVNVIAAAPHGGDALAMLRNYGMPSYTRFAGDVDSPTYQDLQQASILAIQKGGIKNLTQTIDKNKLNTINTQIHTNWQKISPSLPPEALQQSELLKNYQQLTYYKAMRGDPNAAQDAYTDLFHFQMMGKWRVPNASAGVISHTILNDYSASAIQGAKFTATGGMSQGQFKQTLIAHAQPVLSSDGKTYTFYLNNAMVYNADGSPFTINLNGYSDYAKSGAEKELAEARLYEQAATPASTTGFHRAT